MRNLAALALVGLAACAVAPSQGGAPLASAASPNAAPADAAISEAPVTAAPGSKKLDVDTSQRLEVVDLHIDMRQRNALRPVLPYLLRSEEWMLVKMEQTSRHTRHYRFQRVASSQGSFPSPDPLAPTKRP